MDFTTTLTVNLLSVLCLIYCCSLRSTIRRNHSMITIAIVHASIPSVIRRPCPLLGRLQLIILLLLFDCGSLVLIIAALSEVLQKSL